MPVLGALMGFFLLSGAVVAVNPSNAVPISANPAFSVTLTGYNAVPGQTDGDPTVTANGGTANPAVVAARSQDLAAQLPFGTIVAITRAPSKDPNCGFDAVSSLIGYRVITDVMNVKIKDHVDVLFDNHAPIKVGGKTINASWALGSCDNTMITVVGHMSLKDVRDLPDSQADLAALVTHSGLALK